MFPNGPHQQSLSCKYFFNKSFAIKFIYFSNFHQGKGSASYGDGGKNAWLISSDEEMEQDTTITKTKPGLIDTVNTFKNNFQLSVAKEFEKLIRMRDCLNFVVNCP